MNQQNKFLNKNRLWKEKNYMSKFDDDTLAFMIEFDQEGYEAILREEGMI